MRRLISLAICVCLVGCSNSGCGGSQRAKAIEHAELACAQELAAKVAEKIFNAQQAGSNASKAAIALELTAEEVPCVLNALHAQPAAPSSGSGSGAGADAR